VSVLSSAQPSIQRDVVVVGASAGGVEALKALVCGLPPEFPAAVLVVLHMASSGTSVLPQILGRHSKLEVSFAVDGEELRRGQVYVAPPDQHMLVHGSRLRLTHGPRENGHRPAIDPLFRSAARSWGGGAVGVVLSGSRDDGAFGLATIVRHGGTGVVQDPAEALYPSMPRHAIEQTPGARVLPVSKMGPVLAELLDGLRGPAPAVAAEDPQAEAEDAMATLADLTADEAGAVPAGYGCPTCHGALFEMPGQLTPRFRCRVGHAWSGAGLLDEQADAMEGALWMALRSLEEKAALCRRMAGSAELRGNRTTAARYADASAEAEGASRVIRQLIGQPGNLDAAGVVSEMP
jgi:two-component system chemotaxis response regulator CheB